MNPDPYQGIWGGSNCRDSLVQTDRTCSCADGQCQAEDEYLEQLQEIFDNSIGKRVAGFFAEAIQGLGGVVQYPKVKRTQVSNRSIKFSLFISH